MKTYMLYLTLIFSLLVLHACTNDEGETEFDIVDPNEEQLQEPGTAAQPLGESGPF